MKDFIFEIEKLFCEISENKIPFLIGFLALVSILLGFISIVSFCAWLSK